MPSTNNEVNGDLIQNGKNSHNLQRDVSNEATFSRESLITISSTNLGAELQGKTSAEDEKHFPLSHTDKSSVPFNSREIPFCSSMNEKESVLTFKGNKKKNVNIIGLTYGKTESYGNPTTSKPTCANEEADPSGTRNPTAFHGAKRTSTSSLHAVTKNATRRQRMCRYRYGIYILSHITICIQLSCISSIPIAVVCMSEVPASEDADNPNVTDHSNGDVGMVMNVTSSWDNWTRAESSPGNGSSRREGKEFTWDTSDQGLIFSSVTILQLIAPFAAEFLSQKLGATAALQFSVLCTAFVMLASPATVRWNFNAFLALRIISGLPIGFLMIVFMRLLVYWIPEQERDMATSMVFTGMTTAGILGTFVSGYLCEIPVDNGWPFIFYVLGGVMAVSSMVWHVVGSSTPETNRFLSSSEKEYIVKYRRGLDGKKPSKIPFKSILCSPSVYALILVMIAHTWQLVFTMSYIPIYLNLGVGFSVQESGLLTSLSYIVRLCGMFLWASVTRLCQQTLGLSTTNTRRVVMAAGYSMCSIASFALYLADANDKWLVCIPLGFMQLGQGCAVSGAVVYVIDIAPRFAGLLTSIYSTIAGLVSLTCPLVVSAINVQNTMEEWGYVFLLVSGVFAFGIVSFVLLADARLQPWAMDENENNEGGVPASNGISHIASPAMDEPPVDTFIPPAHPAGQEQVRLASISKSQDRGQVNLGYREDSTEGGANVAL